MLLLGVIATPGGSTARAEVSTSRSDARLVAADGTMLTLPVSVSVMSSVVNGITTWTEYQSVGIPRAMLGIDDELTPPEPTDLVVPVDDPASPIVGFEPPPGDIVDDEMRLCESDATAAINVCLKMTYSAYSSGSKRYVRLVSYMHRWIRKDATVAWYGAIARAGVAGYAPSGNYYYNAVTKTIDSPTSDSVYTHKPSWVGVDINVASWKAFQAANNEITLKRGGSTWKFVHSNIYQGTNPGWPG